MEVSVSCKQHESFFQAKTKENIDLIFETIARRLPRTRAPIAPIATTPIVNPQEVTKEKKNCCKQYGYLLFVCFTYDAVYYVF